MLPKSLFCRSHLLAEFFGSFCHRLGNLLTGELAPIRWTQTKGESGTLSGTGAKVMSDRKKYRTYTEAFKLEALALLKSSGKSAQLVERELAITAGMLLKWQNRYQAVSYTHLRAHETRHDLVCRL